jgi:hypothetical protein
MYEFKNNSPGKATNTKPEDDSFVDSAGGMEAYKIIASGNMQKRRRQVREAIKINKKLHWSISSSTKHAKQKEEYINKIEVKI